MFTVNLYFLVTIPSDKFYVYKKRTTYMKINKPVLVLITGNVKFSKYSQ